MKIVGVDGADWRLARDYAPVEPLEVDFDILHTIAIWPQYFTYDTPPMIQPKRYDEPLPGDYFWDRDSQGWTVGNVPVTFPTTDINCSVPETLGLPDSARERWAERLELSEILQTSQTGHTLVVVNGLDKLQHKTSDRDELHEAYNTTFEWVMAHDPDVILSDHGFDNVGGRSGMADHGRQGVVYGLDVEKASEVSDALAARLDA